MHEDQGEEAPWSLAPRPASLGQPFQKAVSLFGPSNVTCRDLTHAGVLVSGLRTIVLKKLISQNMESAT